jgi:hypothetical protein
MSAPLSNPFGTPPTTRYPTTDPASGPPAPPSWPTAARARMPRWVTNPAQNPNLLWTGIALAEAVLVMCLLGVFAGWGWFVVLTIPYWLTYALNIYLGGAFFELPHHGIDRLRQLRAAVASGFPPSPPAPATVLTPRTIGRLIINGVAVVALLLGTVLWATVGAGNPLNTSCADFEAMSSYQQLQLLARLSRSDFDRLMTFDRAIDNGCTDNRQTLGQSLGE